jgi:hypothetical protein
MHEWEEGHPDYSFDDWKKARNLFIERLAIFFWSETPEAQHHQAVLWSARRALEDEYSSESMSAADVEDVCDACKGNPCQCDTKYEQWQDRQWDEGKPQRL